MEYVDYVAAGLVVWILSFVILMLLDTCTDTFSRICDEWDWFVFLCWCFSPLAVALTPSVMIMYSIKNEFVYEPTKKLSSAEVRHNEIKSAIEEFCGKKGHEFVGTVYSPAVPFLFRHGAPFQFSSLGDVKTVCKFCNFERIMFLDNDASIPYLEQAIQKKHGEVKLTKHQMEKEVKRICTLT